MDISNFILNVEDQFEDVKPGEIKANTFFRDIDEWSSLTGLAIMNMISKKYGVAIKQEELRGARTINDLYKIVKEKKENV